MPDVWAAVTDLDDAMQSRLASVLETRGADPQQQEMRRTFLREIPFPPRAHVLEVGCGTGVLTRVLAQWPGVGDVVGIDPARALLDVARRQAEGLSNITFEEADGRAMPYEAETFDVAVFDSTLSHVPGPDRALAEAYRVLRRGGWLATFDGDYATTTVGLDNHDPLQVCVDLMMSNSVTDRWLMRRLPSMVRTHGFEVVGYRSHGFVETAGGYMQTVVERGVDFLLGLGQVGEDAAEALKAETLRRIETGTFFGHIAYVSLTARKH